MIFAFQLLKLEYGFLFQEPIQRGDENSLIIERILILIRNVLYVPADIHEQRPDNDASVHDQVSFKIKCVSSLQFL